MTAPPFAYFGGKVSLAESIVSLLGPHQHYVEPFCGSLSVLLAKSRSPMETVNDLDGDRMLFWQVLRDRPKDLARACALTPHSRAEHDQSFDRRAELGDLERARRVWVRLSQGRGGQMRRTGWRHYANPSGGAGMPDYLAGYTGRIMPAAARLAGVSLECRPALELIAKYGQHSGVLLYVDPPYLGSTRPWGDQYRHELRSDDDHCELADALRACAATVVLSGYASPLYDELYAGWSAVELAAFTGNGKHGDQDRTEVVWSNREIGQPSLLDLLDEEAS